MKFSTLPFLFVFILSIFTLCQAQDSEFDAKEFIKQLDKAQYTLEGAGVKSFSAQAIFDSDMEEVKEFIKADLTWSTENGFDIKVNVNEKRRKKYNPESVRKDLLTYADNFILGFQYVEMLKDYKLSAEKKKGEIVLTATSETLDITSMIFTITKDLRVKNIVLSGSWAKAVHVELKHKKQNGKWYTVSAKFTKVKGAKNELLKTIKTITCSYKKYNNVLILDKIQVDGVSGDPNLGEEPIAFYYKVDLKNIKVQN